MRFPVLRVRGGVLISSWNPHPALAHRPGKVHVQAQLAGELVAFLPEVAPAAAEPRDGLQAPLEAEESAPALDLALPVPSHPLGGVGGAPPAPRAAPAVFNPFWPSGGGHSRSSGTHARRPTAPRRPRWPASPGTA